MTTVIYGGSPRHHNRMTNTAHHLHHPNALQQSSDHYVSSSNPLSSSVTSNPLPSSFSSSYNHSHQNSNLILIPPASYLTTTSPMASSILQQQQQYSQTHSLQTPSSQQQQQQQYQFQHAIVQPPQAPHYHHSSLIYASQRHHTKRKSAVELLAESKPFYVKSETVLDRHQQLTFRGSGTGAVSNSSGTCMLSPSRTHGNGGSSGGGIVGNHRPPNRRSASSSSDLLQTKLRKLLNTDAKDCAIPENPRYKVDTLKYDTFSKYQTVKYNQKLSVHPSTDQSDMSVMFPSAFLSPQSLPPHPTSGDDIYSYDCDEPLVLTEDYRAISPPAEYAAVDSSHEKTNTRCSYQRSYSHSHEANSDDPDYSSPSFNINSHKSLPDLHAQISRHSPHSEVLSCCSRGNRSNKSGGGSSLNRDSGGSSGHYTHRSEPCCKQKMDVTVNKMCNSNSDFRRDSGSSTQHSGNSYYTYGVSSSRYDCPECRAKYQEESECLLNFTTPEVPEAFQDDYSEKQARFYEDPSKSVRKMYLSSSHRQHQQHQQQQSHHQQQQHNPTSKLCSGGGGIAESSIQKDPSEISPPLGTFKRQKCLRFKHRNRYSTSNDRNSMRGDSSEPSDDRKPILRSKSDISDRYWNRNNSPLSSESSGKIPICGSNGSSGNGNGVSNLERHGKSESLSQLEKFFDRLGLNDDKFNEIYNSKRRYSSDNDSDQSSTVFFSDVSTVDSTRLPDSTETNQNGQAYRTTEPPSIVERNARIIKWLCNCRKLQLT